MLCQFPCLGALDLLLIDKLPEVRCNERCLQGSCGWVGRVSDRSTTRSSRE